MSAWSVHLRRFGGEPTSPRDRRRVSRDDFVIVESVGYLVNRLARQMAGDLADELRPLGVGIGQWAILLFLWHHDGQSQAQLARRVAIEPPTMVRTIDRMVRDGLVTREPDPDDGRAFRISLTEHGAALRDALVPRAVAVNEATLSRLSSAERTTFSELLRKLIDD